MESPWAPAHGYEEVSMPNRSRRSSFAVRLLTSGPMATTVLLGFACGSMGGLFFCSAIGWL
jgi:hypothetical protein